MYPAADSLSKSLFRLSVSAVQTWDEKDHTHFAEGEEPVDNCEHLGEELGF